MNKLLQHMIDLGDVDHKILPVLQTFQSGGQSRMFSMMPSDNRGDIASLPGVRIQVPVSRQELDENRKRIEAKKAADNARILADRRAGIKASIDARSRPFSPQQIADETQAIGDKFRLFPDDPNSFFDDYLNPAVAIGDMASGIGRVPLNLQQGNYGQALMAVGVPLAAGAFAGVRPNNSRQVARNISSKPEVVRGNINWWEEPGFRKRNPNFSAEAYLNSAGKFGKYTMDEVDESLMPFDITTLTRDQYKKFMSDQRLRRRRYIDPFEKFPTKRRIGGPIVDTRGQWAYPGQRTIVPTPTGRITMQGVPYPVYGQDETGFGQMMYPGGEYQFPGQMVDEIPMMQPGGTLPTYQTKGQVQPIYVTNPNDPRFQAYKDSLELYNRSMYNHKQLMRPDFARSFNGGAESGTPHYYPVAKRNSDSHWNNNYQRKFNGRDYNYVEDQLLDKRNTDLAGKINLKSTYDISKRSKIRPVKNVEYFYGESPTGGGQFLLNMLFKKPVQQVIYKKPQPIVEPPKVEQPVGAPVSVPVPPVYQMKGRTPVYGPTQSLIGMLGDNNLFYPDYSNTAARSNANQADSDMIQNMQMLQEYLRSKGVDPKVVPRMKSGGQHGGLDRWFAEKWVDVKTGKPCGRQEGESRAYPACRPSRRVSSKTPKTASEMSPAEKAKFKRSKTSSERINYNHKRN